MIIKGPDVNDTLSVCDFDKLRAFIKEKIGISLKPEKRVMLETRIRKRCMKLGLPLMKEYCKYVLSPQGLTQEMDSFIDLVTTNKTDFFREPHHFDFLVSEVLPEFYRNGYKRDFICWSSACSTGAEPYTLAITLQEYKDKNLSFSENFKIIATDISTAVLQNAYSGIYKSSDLDPVPEHLKHKYFMKSKKIDDNRFKVVPELRNIIDFRRLNLNKSFKFETPMDIIFCRNVMIYFDKDTQFQLVRRMVSNLRTDGYLFMGHSELLDTTKHDSLKSCGPSIYRKIK